MKIIVPASQLKTPVLQVSKYARADKTVPFLEMLYFNSLAGEHVVMGTNLNNFAVHKLTFPSLEPFLISSTQISRWVRKLRKDELIALEIKDDLLIMQSNRFSAAFPISREFDNFPVYTVIEDSVLKFDVAPEFLIKASSQDYRRPMLVGLTVRNDGMLVCADGFRLHVEKTSLEWFVEKPDEVEPIKLAIEPFNGLKGVVAVWVSKNKKVFAIQQGPLTITGLTQTPPIQLGALEEQYSKKHGWMDVPIDAQQAFEEFREHGFVNVRESGIRLQDEESQVVLGSNVYRVEVLAHCIMPLPETSINPAMMADALAFVGWPAKVRQDDETSPVSFKSERRRAMVMPAHYRPVYGEGPDVSDHLRFCSIE